MSKQARVFKKIKRLLRSGKSLFIENNNVKSIKLFDKQRIFFKEYGKFRYQSNIVPSKAQIKLQCMNYNYEIDNKLLGATPKYAILDEILEKEINN